MGELIEALAAVRCYNAAIRLALERVVEARATQFNERTAGLLNRGGTAVVRRPANNSLPGRSHPYMTV